MLLRLGLKLLLVAGFIDLPAILAQESTSEEVSEKPEDEEVSKEDEAPSEESKPEDPAAEQPSEASPIEEGSTPEPASSEKPEDKESPAPEVVEDIPKEDLEKKIEEEQQSETDHEVKKTQKKLKKDKSKKKISLSGGMSYTQFFSDLVDPSLSFSFSLVYLKNKKTSISVSQSVSKLLVKNQEDDELVPQDTSISYTFKPKLTFFGGGHASVGSSLRLPVSQYSRKNGVWTTIGLRSSLTWYYLDKKLSNTAGISGSIYGNQYRTRHEDYGGGALPYLSGTASWSLSYSGYQDLVFSLSASYGEIRYYNIEDENFFADTSFDHPYSIGLSASYMVMESLSLGLSYGQSNIFEQYGNLDYYVFDDENSNLNLSLSYSKSF
ncbi:MAG: hypothetical protein HRU09_13625 [Oligoflexales bacterium]|nr:hypothetical protein [Oligoflexales bacterium]